MGQSCCRNSTIPDFNDKLNNNLPQQYSIQKQQDTFTRINELENNVQISLEVMSKLNTTIQNLVVQVEDLNKQLEQKQNFVQNQIQEEK